MFLGTVNNLIQQLQAIPILATPAVSTSTSQTPGQQSQDSPATPPATAEAGHTDGVIFDLSDAALQAVAAATQPTPVSAEEVVAPVPALTPAGIAVAAAISSLDEARTVKADAADHTVAETAPAPVSAEGTAPSAEPAPPATDTAQASDLADAAPAADPDEEARARAAAIDAQGRERLRDIAEDLAQPAAPMMGLTAAAGEAGAPNDDGPRRAA